MITEIGPWSETKLAILRDYAAEYTKILNKQLFIKHIYIDAFSGSGQHISKESGEIIDGSPLSILSINPPFKEYHFIDINPERTEHLRLLLRNVTGRKYFIHNGDCNRILIDDIFPTICYKDYVRALCFLDPYGIHLDWHVILKAAESKCIEIVLNFSTMDSNRNFLLSNPTKLNRQLCERMDKFWGDESWNQVKEEQTDLFGGSSLVIRPNIVSTFQRRLKEVAGFKFVPDPIAMRNSIDKTIYYIFYASHNETGNKIISHVFKKYREKEDTNAKKNKN